MGALTTAVAGGLGPDIHIVRYEDLVDGPEREVRRLCEFLGEDYEAGMLEVGRQNSSYFRVEQDRDRTGINAASKERWRQALEPVEIRLAQSICGSGMRAFGYEPIAVRRGLGDTRTVLRILLLLPGRAFNLFFRTGKPFTWNKVRRILSALRGQS
jgi:hypothetical protein